MKYARILFGMIFMILCFRIQGFAADVFVTIPDFDITLNGEILDCENSEYPPIVYKDITYIPLSWNMNQFMGLVTEFRPYGYDVVRPDRFYVGNSATRSEILENDIAAVKNRHGKKYAAAVAEYQIYIGNGIRVENSSDEYPLLNFRGVTYLPLTWEYAYDVFDWDYSFDKIKGLVINTADAVRPEWNYWQLWNTSPHRRYDNYLFGRHWYIGYPGTTYGEVDDFVLKRKGEDEKRFNLKEQLYELHITSLATEPLNEYSWKTRIPAFDGENLQIYCSAHNVPLILTINMETGQITDVKSL